MLTECANILVLTEKAPLGVLLNDNSREQSFSKTAMGLKMRHFEHNHDTVTFLQNFLKVLISVYHCSNQCRVVTKRNET